MNGLGRRLEALEARISTDDGHPCTSCGLGRVYDVLSLDVLQARYTGSREPTPPICPCACCAPVFADLVGRLSRRRDSAA
jgi:hypothetical protein